MKNFMPRLAWQILFSSAALVLLAAGCNSSQQAAVQTPVAESPALAPTPAPVNPTPAPAPAPTSPTPATPSPATPPVQASPVLKLSSSSSLGQYLIAANGMTLYTYGGDTANASNCTGACAVNWPPYKASATAQLAATAGISGKIGTITRADGSTQLTYKNMPLYFWVNDAKVGDTTGNGINSFAIVKP